MTWWQQLARWWRQRRCPHAIAEPAPEGFARAQACLLCGARIRIADVAEGKA